ncbi:hypothetical protein ACFVYP_07145 [Kitasatospora sp. NPDC058201]|uniref:hypothetical protein n=1 Tax=unclassified Kitasatospora TaxID=2633591 RepID=UPI003658F05B
MSLAGGTPPSTEPREELGICPVCRAWVRGPWLADLTALTALVRHCPPSGWRSLVRLIGPVRVRAAYAVSAAGVLVLATLLIISTIHR